MGIEGKRERETMNVTELNREQLIEMKQTYLMELEDCGEHEDVVGISWNELANADELVPDDIIFDKYAGIIFTDDDFWCSMTAE